MILWLKALGITFIIFSVMYGFFCGLNAWETFCLRHQYGVAVFMAPFLLVAFTGVVTIIHSSLRSNSRD